MRIALVLAALVALAPAARGQAVVFDRDCAKWIEQHGYSVDYIKLKTGKRQRGVAETWRGNVEPKDAQPGDVAMSYIKDKGRHMRVAYVEDVHKNADGSTAAVVISEWNMGRYIDEPCYVTDHFGRDSGRKVLSVDGFVRVWRPSRPLPAAAVE